MSLRSLSALAADAEDLDVDFAVLTGLEPGIRSVHCTVGPGLGPQVTCSEVPRQNKARTKHVF